MAAPSKVSRQKLVVLDTCVLFHLAEQHAPSHNLVLRLVRMGLTPIVGQTVIQELGYFAEQNADQRKKQLATTALTSMLQWGIQPMALKPVGNGICEIVSDVMFGRGLLPPDEKNDACIVIEAGFCGAAMLVTWDNHILGASNAAINEVLTSFDLHPIQIVAPKVILGY